MITKKQMRNAERIKTLADEFGHLHYNTTQTVESLLNLSIPCAQLVVAGVVTGVRDTYDGINDQAVEDVERYCRIAVDRLTESNGTGWWTETATKLELP